MVLKAAEFGNTEPTGAWGTQTGLGKPITRSSCSQDIIHHLRSPGRFGQVALWVHQEEKSTGESSVDTPGH